MLISAAAGNGSGAVHVSLAWPALALPAMVAIAWYRAVWRQSRPLWLKAPVVALGACVGTAVSAASIAWVLGSVSWTQVALRPWEVPGHQASVAAAVGWTAALLAWIRGTWLAARPPSFRQAAWSVGVGAAAFLAVFAGRIDHQAPKFLAETNNVGWSLLLFFPVSATVLALVRQRDLEEQILDRSPSAPGLAWLAVLSVPMLGVAILAVAIGWLLGAGAPAIIRTPRRAVGAAWGGIEAAAVWVWDLGNGPTHPRRPAGHPPPFSRGIPSHAATRGAVHSSFSIPGYVWAIVTILIIVVLARFALRHLAPVTRWRGAPDVVVDSVEERTSLFSWRHFMAQLASSLARLLGALRFWRRGPVDQRPTENRDSLSGYDATGLPPVRAAYRSVLATARLAGRPRRPSETAHDFQTRLSPDLTGPAAGALHRLTSGYEIARYGGKIGTAPAGSATLAEAEAVRASLAELGPPVVP